MTDKALELVELPLKAEIAIIEELHNRYAETLDDMDAEIALLEKELENLMKELVVLSWRGWKKFSTIAILQPENPVKENQQQSLSAIFRKRKKIERSWGSVEMPNKDRNIPKRRFKAFENDPAWELRKIFEIADRFDNLRVPIASSLRVSGSTPYYGANGIQDYVEGYTHEGSLSWLLKMEPMI